MQLLQTEETHSLPKKNAPCSQLCKCFRYHKRTGGEWKSIREDGTYEIKPSLKGARVLLKVNKFNPIHHGGSYKCGGEVKGFGPVKDAPALQMNGKSLTTTNKL